MGKLLIAGLLLAMLAGAASADVARTDLPKNGKSVDTTLSIRIDRTAKEARLIIPKSQLKQLRAELEQLDKNQPEAAAFAFSKAETIAAGSLLSLAFVFGGVWFARKGRSGAASKALGIGAVMLAGGAFATLVYANAGPPSEARSITGKLFTQSVHLYKFAYGKIKLETTDDESNVLLIVPDTTDAKPGEE